MNYNVTGASTDPAGSPRQAPLRWGVGGAVLGTVFGILLTMGVAIWAIATASDRGTSVAVEPIVSVEVTEGDSVNAKSGDGILIPSLAGALLGGVAGVAWGSRRRENARPLSDPMAS